MAVEDATVSSDHDDRVEEGGSAVATVNLVQTKNDCHAFPGSRLPNWLKVLR